MGKVCHELGKAIFFLNLFTNQPTKASNQTLLGQSWESVRMRYLGLATFVCHTLAIQPCFEYWKKTPKTNFIESNSTIKLPTASLLMSNIRSRRFDLLSILLMSVFHPLASYAKRGITTKPNQLIGVSFFPGQIFFLSTITLLSWKKNLNIFHRGLGDVSSTSNSNIWNWYRAPLYKCLLMFVSSKKIKFLKSLKWRGLGDCESLTLISVCNLEGQIAEVPGPKRFRFCWVWLWRRLDQRVHCFVWRIIFHSRKVSLGFKRFKWS